MSIARSTNVSQARSFAAAAAVVVVIDALSVGAPGLGLLGLPFVIVAIGYRNAHRPTRYVAAAWCALYLVLAVNYVAANGVDAPWGDLLFAFGGSAAVIGLLVSLFRRAAPARGLTPA